MGSVKNFHHRKTSTPFPVTTRPPRPRPHPDSGYTLKREEPGKACPLFVGEVLRAGPQDGLDAEQGLALAAPVPAGGVLDSASDLVHDGGAELDHMKRVQDGGRVFELLVDRGLVAPERVQGRDTHAGPERVATLAEPVGVGLLRSSRHEVQQTGVDSSSAIAGQVDHPGQLLRALRAPVAVMPYMLVNAQ